MRMTTGLSSVSLMLIAVEMHYVHWVENFPLAITTDSNDTTEGNLMELY